MSLPDPPPLEIESHALAEMRAAGAVHAVVDVREPWELSLARFPQALHVPLGELAGAHEDLPHDLALVVICHHGQRSLLAAGQLRAHGFAASSLKGGLEAWAVAVDPQMPRYRSPGK